MIEFNGTRFTVQLLLTDKKTGHQMTISGPIYRFLKFVTWLSPISSEILEKEQDYATQTADQG